MAVRSKINVKILAATQTFFDGEAYAVTSVNDLGKFDILEGHTAFICLIKDRITIYKTPHDDIQIPINRGVLTVADNKVKVYLGF